MQNVPALIEYLKIGLFKGIIFFVVSYFMIYPFNAKAFAKDKTYHITTWQQFKLTKKIIALLKQSNNIITLINQRNKLTVDFTKNNLNNFIIDKTMLTLADSSFTNEVIKVGGQNLLTTKTTNTIMNVMNLDGVHEAKSVSEENGEIILSPNISHDTNDSDTSYNVKIGNYTIFLARNSKNSTNNKKNNTAIFLLDVKKWLRVNRTLYLIETSFGSGKQIAFWAHKKVNVNSFYKQNTNPIISLRVDLTYPKNICLIGQSNKAVNKLHTLIFAANHRVYLNAPHTTYLIVSNTKISKTTINDQLIINKLKTYFTDN